MGRETPLWEARVHLLLQAPLPSLAAEMQNPSPLLWGVTPPSSLWDKGQPALRTSVKGDDTLPALSYRFRTVWEHNAGLLKAGSATRYHRPSVWFWNWLPWYCQVPKAELGILHWHETRVRAMEHSSHKSPDWCPCIVTECRPFSHKAESPQREISPWSAVWTQVSPAFWKFTLYYLAFMKDLH